MSTDPSDNRPNQRTAGLIAKDKEERSRHHRERQLAEELNQRTAAILTELAFQANGARPRVGTVVHLDDRHGHISVVFQRTAGGGRCERAELGVTARDDGTVEIVSSGAGFASPRPTVTRMETLTPENVTDHFEQFLAPALC